MPPPPPTHTLLPTPMSWKSSMHQRLGSMPGFFDVRQMSDSYTIFRASKKLALGQGFDVRLLSDCCYIFHAPKTWFYARPLMSGNCQKVVQSSMTQRPGFTSGFWCQATVRQLYNLLIDLASFQGFNVRQLSDTYTIFYSPNTCILMLFVVEVVFVA